MTTPHLNTASVPHGNTPAVPGVPHSNTPEVPFYNRRGVPFSNTPGVPFSNTPGVPFSNTPGVPFSNAPGVPHSNTPGVPFSNTPGVPFSNIPAVPGVPHSLTPGQPFSNTPAVPGVPFSNTPGVPFSNIPDSGGAPFSNTPAVPAVPHTNVPAQFPGDVHTNTPATSAVPHSNQPATPYYPHDNTPGVPHANTPAVPAVPFSNTPAVPFSNIGATPYVPHSNTAAVPHSNTGVPFSNSPGVPFSNTPGVPFSNTPGVPFSNTPGVPFSNAPGFPFYNRPGQPFYNRPGVPGVPFSNNVAGSPSSFLRDGNHPYRQRWDHDYEFYIGRHTLTQDSLNAIAESNRRFVDAGGSLAEIVESERGARAIADAHGPQSDIWYEDVALQVWRDVRGRLFRGESTRDDAEAQLAGHGFEAESLKAALDNIEAQRVETRIAHDEALQVWGDVRERLVRGEITRDDAEAQLAGHGFEAESLKAGLDNIEALGVGFTEHDTEAGFATAITILTNQGYTADDAAVVIASATPEQRQAIIEGGQSDTPVLSVDRAVSDVVGADADDLDDAELGAYYQANIAITILTNQGYTADDAAVVIASATPEQRQVIIEGGQSDTPVLSVDRAVSDVVGADADDLDDAELGANIAITILTNQGYTADDAAVVIASATPEQRQVIIEGGQSDTPVLSVDRAVSVVGANADDLDDAELGAHYQANIASRTALIGVHQSAIAEHGGDADTLGYDYASMTIEQLRHLAGSEWQNTAEARELRHTREFRGADAPGRGADAPGRSGAGSLNRTAPERHR